MEDAVTVNMRSFFFDYINVDGKHVILGKHHHYSH